MTEGKDINAVYKDDEGNIIGTISFIDSLFKGEFYRDLVYYNRISDFPYTYDPLLHGVIENTIIHQLIIEKRVNYGT